MITEAVMSLPKMHWLPKDEWEAPRVRPNSGELSGKAPLAGLFSDFWSSPCLLPARAGAGQVSLPASSESAGPPGHSAELAGEVAPLDVSAASGLASPASELSDGSAQAGMPAVKQVERCEPGVAHGRGTQQSAPSPEYKCQQGAGLPGSTKPEQKQQVGSMAQAKRRRRDDADDGLLESPAKERLSQPSGADTSDRSLSRERDCRLQFQKDRGRYEPSRSREPSTAKARSMQAKHGSRHSQYSASRPRSACRRDSQWPFKEGRIIPCSTKMSVDMLGNLKFGSDQKEDLEGLSTSTAVFLWNYEKQKMHGIFSGTSRPIEDTSKHAPYLYEVRVKNYADYPSLPKEVALRLVPRDGKTSRGETLLKPHLDADHVDRLCSAFAK